MGRIATSFELMKASWAVLRTHRQLALFPVLSVLAAGAISLIFLVPMVVVYAGGTTRSTPVWAYPMLFAMYFALAFVQSFFNAALISSANDHFEGRQPTIAGGVATAWRHAGTIAGWALIAATVGLVLRSLQERSGLLGRLIVGAIGVAWNLLTFFVVPVLVLEGVGPITAVKRSGHIFKAKWGESVVGAASIGLAAFVFMLPVIAVMAAGALLVSTSVALGVGLILAAFVALVAISMVTSAMQQIYNTALYRYATTSSGSGAFTADRLEQSFRPKGGWLR